MNEIELYHGSNEILEFPEIRKSAYTKDFSWGFYCTNNYEQATRWVKRKKDKKIINVYYYTENSDLRIKKFPKMTEEWLDFIVNCRNGKVHNYDIVEGPMADDTIWNFVNDFVNGNVSREAFWELTKFKKPTHQISFHTLEALDCIKFERSDEIDD